MHQLAVAGLQVQRDVGGHPELSGDQVYRASLRHVAGDAVEHVPAAGRLRRDDRLPGHVQYDLVGHQLAAVQMLLDGPAQLGPPGHMVA